MKPLATFKHISSKNANYGDAEKYIEAPDKSSGKRHQDIRISYDLVGFIPVEELLKQETA